MFFFGLSLICLMFLGEIIFFLLVLFGFWFKNKVIIVIFVFVFVKLCKKIIKNKITWYFFNKKTLYLKKL